MVPPLPVASMSLNEHESVIPNEVCEVRNLSFPDRRRATPRFVRNPGRLFPTRQVVFTNCPRLRLRRSIHRQILRIRLRHHPSHLLRPSRLGPRPSLHRSQARSTRPRPCPPLGRYSRASHRIATSARPAEQFPAKSRFRCHLNLFVTGPAIAVLPSGLHPYRWRCISPVAMPRRDSAAVVAVSEVWFRESACIAGPRIRDDGLKPIPHFRPVLPIIRRDQQEHSVFLFFLANPQLLE